jgi:hypothetical protein
MAFIDDAEEPEFTVSPSDNVYAYFMFVPPTEEKKEGTGMTFDIIMAYILLGFNFFMQGFLLWVVYNVVVTGNAEWQNSIARSEGGGLDLLNLNEGKDKCNPGGSLCFMTKNKTYSCAPPSVQLTGRWEELDTNGDGIWTLEEVTKAKEALQCKYIVNPIEVFNVFITFLKAREKIIWLHPDVKAGKAIHKPYFWYAAGDIIMCGYRNELACPNIMKKGFLDAPLKHGTAPRVGTTIESALTYCNNLLKPDGICVKTLPSTYSVWKISSSDQCQGSDFSKFVYKHPKTGMVKSMLEVDYAAPGKYRRSKTLIFQTYKCIIIGMWLLAILCEFKDITIATTWVLRFPDAKDFGEDAVLEEKDDAGEVTNYSIQGITTTHRIMVGLMTLGRFLLTWVLLITGVSFLLKATDYIGLLMDAVALVFIVEIAIILYGQVLRGEIREQCEGLSPMTVRMYGIDYLNRRQAIVDVIQITCIILATIAVLYNWTETAVNPIYDALSCACLSDGDKCHEAHKFDYDFWWKYWKEDVPAVFKAVDGLKKGAASAFAEVGKTSLPSTLLSLNRGAGHLSL